MPIYTYKGISQTGIAVTGVVEAYDEVEAMERAREFCRIVQSVKEVKDQGGLLSFEITKRKMKPKNIATVCSQFSIILQAGLPIARAVSLVGEQTDDKYLKKVLILVAADVSAGHGLADSLENKGPDLPRVFVETIRAGEESGRLSESFSRLHDYYDKRAKVGAKVAGALTYPVFVFIIAIVVVALMMVMVIPAISSMVTSLGSEMPAITRFLIDVSDWVSHNVFLILIVIVLLLVGIKLYSRTEPGKTLIATMQLRLPVLGVISVFSGASQFANTMATLVAVGLPITRAVRVTGRVLDNHVLSREVGHMELGLEEGKSLGECLETSEFLPRTLIEMCVVGEQTGELEQTLNTVGAFYDSETQRVTDRALSLLEPALLVVMAVFAGFIVISLYLPMFTMYASM